MAKREHPTEYQRYLIKFLNEEMNLSPAEIREHSKMQRSTGGPFALKVVCLYIFFWNSNRLFNFFS